MPMKKKFPFVWNGKGRLEVWNFVFFTFSNRKQGNKYVQNILLTPLFNDESS